MNRSSAVSLLALAFAALSIGYFYGYQNGMKEGLARNAEQIDAASRFIAANQSDPCR